MVLATNLLANSFQVYIAEMQGDASDCAEKNIHNWKQADIQKVIILLHKDLGFSCFLG